jgi:D-xylose transport system ATP-binding protein
MISPQSCSRSEGQAALAGAICQGRDATVILVAGPVEDDRLDALLLGPGGEQLADLLGLGGLGVEVVYQDLALCDNLDIVQNMFLGRELRRNVFGRGVVLDDLTMEDRARETLASLSVRTVKSVRQSVASLSGGQRQTVAIAKAVLWNSRIVLLDEPTAALGVAQTRQVLDLVRRLADRGLGVVLISHNMNDVFEVADRITALYLGRVAADVPAEQVTHNQVVELITAGRSGDLGIRDVAAATI